MEIWEDILWYEWLYQVSNLWNVKSLPKKWSWWHNWKILKNNISWSWRKIVMLRKNNLWKMFYLHRLVAQAFLWLDINNPKILVCHKDDNPLNNNIKNLFLWTSKDNIQDMIRKWRSISQIKKKVLLKYKKNKLEDFDNDWFYNDWFVKY